MRGLFVFVQIHKGSHTKSALNEGDQAVFKPCCSPKFQYA